MAEVDAQLRQSKQRVSLIHLQQGQYYKWNPDISLIPPIIAHDSNRVDPDQTRSPSNSDVRDDDDADSGNASDAAEVYERPISGDLSWQQNGFIESDSSDSSDEAVVKSTNASLEAGQDSLFYYSPAPNAGHPGRSYEV
jgi:hypothetical protein